MLSKLQTELQPQPRTVALVKTSPTQCSPLEWEEDPCRGIHGTRPDAGKEGTWETVLCSALLQYTSQACSLPSKMLHPEDRNEVPFTPVSNSALSLAPSKMFTDQKRKASKITWKNILRFDFPTIRHQECSTTVYWILHSVGKRTN